MVFYDVKSSNEKAMQINIKDEDLESVLFEKASILIADDKSENRVLIKKFLENQPLIVEEVSDGMEAIEAASIYHPDIILMDIKMKKMSGIAAARNLRDNNIKSKIIAVSASSMHNETRLDSFDAYLRKPFKKAELFNTLARFLSYTIEQTQKSGKVDFKSFEFSDEEKEALKAALMNIDNSMMIENIEAFAKQLLLMSRTQKTGYLKVLGHELLEYCENFDVENIQRFIKRVKDKL